MKLTAITALFLLTLTACGDDNDPVEATTSSAPQECLSLDNPAKIEIPAETCPAGYTLSGTNFDGPAGRQLIVCHLNGAPAICLDQ
ncbi:hypothetical protein [Pseudobacteriovorax antillogorgiicola]|uniref:Hemolysin n=2 Tax=Pseudobacteriovorax antillogorgiicola TaxID=1513793 RepID=A0A1Y6BWR6_9BACT|nr:hypothetical protein [Pseudobacteriovorax antillogorgiicola]TCS53165.1 hypothetical protein EDD56_108216 [Pseudobacteriovorax antillogorgiicola]SMF24946.1 hypothetical protein SAMN06296036_10830 [Pseudobacteriovorax antillogorgiicola]